MVPWWKNEAGRVEEIWVWISRHDKEQHVLEFLEQQDSVAQMKKGQLFEYFKKCGKLYIESLKKAIKSVDSEKHELENQEESVLKTQLAFLTIKRPMQETNCSWFKPKRIEKEKFNAALVKYIKPVLM